MDNTKTVLPTLSFTTLPTLRSQRFCFDYYNNFKKLKNNLTFSSGSAIMFWISCTYYLKSRRKAEGHYYVNASSIFDIRYRYLNISRSGSERIPRILYHIWLTNERQCREILDKDIKNVLRTHEVFLKSNPDWRHVVWVNDKKIIPDSVKKLEQNGIQVREISEVKDHLRLGKKLDEFIEKGYWGMASDSLRYEISTLFGGVYADLNYVFERDVEEEIHKYDFFAQMECGEAMCGVIPSIFGSIPNHPILKEATNLVYSNLYDPSDYISEFKNHDRKTVVHKTTGNMLHSAYHKVANRNETIDVIYPYPDYIVSVGSDELSFENAARKEMGRIIRNYIKSTEDVDFIESYWNFIFYVHRNGFCGTKDHIIGEDEHAESWL